MTYEGAVAELRHIEGHKEMPFYLKPALSKVIETLEMDRKVRGQWKPNFRYGMYKSEKFFICSECNEQNMEKSNYCPWCGADMKGE